MGDVTTVGLGFQGNNANRFESSILGQAPGSAAFYACVLVHVRESLLVAPTQCAYFGNFNNIDAGWELGRAADIPASDPPNSPEIVTFRVRLGAGGIVEELTYAMDASTIFGRTHMLAVSVIGLVATLYLNGTAVSSLTLGAPLALGASRLTYGNRSGGGQRSGDPIVAAAYTDTDAAAFILNQRLLFDRIRAGGNLAASIPALGLSAAYIYEGFSQKAPNAGVPTLPLTNFGVAGLIGNLTFVGSTALNVNIDTDPDYTGGAQSSSAGPQVVNLQGAYDNGPTGLIVTGANGPVGVDDILIQNNEIFTETGVTPANLQISAGGTTTDGNPGADLALASGVGGDETGAGNTAGAGGNITVVAANAGNTAAQADGGVGGTVLVSGGDGSDVTSADAGSVGGTGGQVIIQGGDGGDATDGAAFAGSGGEVNIEAGGAGVVVAGAAEGVGGLLNLSGGNGGTGTGGEARLRSGNGDVASGNLAVSVGNSSGLIGLLSVLGGNAQGLGGGAGGDVVVTGGSPANGTDQNGGNATVSGGPGDGTGLGGAASLFGGDAEAGQGGTAIVRGGLSTTGPGGAVTVNGGQAGGANPGGAVDILGGTGNAAGGTGGDIFVRSGNGNTAATAGFVQVGLALGAGGPTDATVGGWYLDPTNGRFSLRTYTVGGANTGSLKVHELNTAGEALQSPAQQGLFHFQTQQAAGVATTIGFRASKSGDYGLMARVYQRTIDASGTYVVVHNLDCNAPAVAVYNAAGLAVVPTSVQQDSLDQITVTAVVAGGGFLTVIGI